MNIYNVGNSFYNKYLVELHCGLCLIDTGYKWEYKKFLKGMQKQNKKIEDIKYVIITHAHADHVGFLKELLTYINPTVIYHPAQRPRLEAGKNDLNTYVSTFTALLSSKLTVAMVDKYQLFPAVKCDDFVPYTENPLQKYGVEFLPLSGHTDADLAIKIYGDLFCGDIFMNCPPSSHKFPLWVLNKFRLITSWEKIVANKEISVIYPSHGKPFTADQIIENMDYWREKGVFKLFKTKDN